MARAVVLAGGLGTRLKPYTISLPKPLVPVGDKPILEIILGQLGAHGFDRVTLAVNHQAELLKAYFGDGTRWGVNVDYSVEPQALGTMGPLKLISALPDDFLVMNGDVLTDLDFEALLSRHVSGKRLFTIAAARREQHIDYGVLDVGEAGQLAGFREKPSIPYVVSMGVYCLNRRVLDFIPGDRLFGFDQLVLDLLRLDEPVRIELHEGYWLDIGRPDDYQKAVEDWTDLSATMRRR